MHRHSAIWLMFQAAPYRTMVPYRLPSHTEWVLIAACDLCWNPSLLSPLRGFLKRDTHLKMSHFSTLQPQQDESICERIYCLTIKGKGWNSVVSHHSATQSYLLTYQPKHSQPLLYLPWWDEGPLLHTIATCSWFKWMISSRTMLTSLMHFAVPKVLTISLVLWVCGKCCCMLLPLRQPQK